MNSTPTAPAAPLTPGLSAAKDTPSRTPLRTSTHTGTPANIDAASAGPTAPPLFEAIDVSRRFGGVIALDAVSITIRSGEIYGLIGPNGAGKTTLFDVLTGVQRADHGSCRLAGRELPRGRPDHVLAAGIARTFQNIRLFGELDARENVLIGLHRQTHASMLAQLLRTRAVTRRESAARARAQTLLDYVGLAHLADRVANSLSYGDRRRLEIARALASGPCLLALDEPAAGMNATETRALAELIRRIRDDGTTVLLIEHDMRLVMSLCDRIAVLDSGRKIAEGNPDEVRTNEAVIEAYLGRRHAH